MMFACFNVRLREASSIMSICSRETATSVLRVCWAITIGTGWFLLVMLRLGLFYPLLWLRMLVVPITHFIAVVAMIALCIAALLYPEPAMLWRFGLLSFGAFMTGWLYDCLLLWLSPQAITFGSDAD